MNKALLSLRLAAIFTTPLAFIPSVYAQNNLDPRDRGCEQDAEILTSIPGGTYRPNPFRSIDVRVELRKSEKCKANWVKANVPSGTVLYLKNNAGQIYVSYTAQVNGWNYSNMWNYSQPFRACVKLPDSREVCTDPV